jgi:hypothetical protein
MLIGNMRSSVELICEGDAGTGPDEPTGGDIGVLVQVKNGAFSASRSVWLNRDDLRSFAQQIGELEQTRVGTAELRTKWTSDFRLCISIIDRPGHLAVSGEVAEMVWVQEMTGENRLSFLFALEPSLPTLASEIQSFLKEALSPGQGATPYM